MLISIATKISAMDSGKDNINTQIYNLKMKWQITAAQLEQAPLLLLLAKNPVLGLAERHKIMQNMLLLQHQITQLEKLKKASGDNKSPQ